MNKSLFTLSLLCCLPAFGMQRRVAAATMRAATARAARGAAAAVRANWAAHSRLMATQSEREERPDENDQASALELKKMRIENRIAKIQTDYKSAQNIILPSGGIGAGIIIGIAGAHLDLPLIQTAGVCAAVVIPAIFATSRFLSAEEAKEIKPLQAKLDALD